MGSTCGSDSYTKHLAFSIDSAIHQIWLVKHQNPVDSFGGNFARGNPSDVGGGFVARDHTASVFASRVLPRLSQLGSALWLFLVGWLVGWLVVVAFFCSGPSIFKWRELRQKMAVVPPILVLNYTLPSNPQQVKQEVEARSAILKNREWCREKREIIHKILNKQCTLTCTKNSSHNSQMENVSPKICVDFFVDFPQVTLSWLRGQGFHEMVVAGLQFSSFSMLIGGGWNFCFIIPGFFEAPTNIRVWPVWFIRWFIQCRKRLTKVDANRDAQMRNLDCRFPYYITSRWSQLAGGWALFSWEMLLSRRFCRWLFSSANLLRTDASKDLWCCWDMSSATRSKSNF